MNPKEKRLPKLKLFNGNSADDPKTHVYLAAKSRKRAAEIMGTSDHYLKNYFADCWGPKAQELIGTPTQEGWWQIRDGVVTQIYPPVRPVPAD